MSGHCEHCGETMCICEEIEKEEQKRRRDMFAAAALANSNLVHVVRDEDSGMSAVSVSGTTRLVTRVIDALLAALDE